ncbi:MAG: hypothetical protein ACM3X0_12450 [Bacteroidota bacterium]
MRTDAPPSLLYRYFFFDWLFRDVAAGTLFERSAAWQHNRWQSRWLPTYLRRWIGLSLLLFGIAASCSLLFGEHWVCAPLYILFSVTTSVCSIIIVAWLGLKFLPKP